YIGKLEDGTVFDTTYEDIAKDKSIPKSNSFEERDVYAPLSFTIGSGQLISGFEEAVIGMKVGEEKEVVIPPEKAYGFRNEELVSTLPRIAERPRTENISVLEFRSIFGEEIDLYVGTTVPLNERYWGKNSIKRWDTARVVAIDWKKSIITLSHEPPQGSLIEIPWGQIQINFNETTITERFIPLINKTAVNREGKYVTIVDYGEEYMTVDYNHPLAGKTLMFKIKLEEIQS
ncbi:MAG: peptidylprolyl isomerase, partial [Candidatus Hydrothermarchaeales archaeon]